MKRRNMGAVLSLWAAAARAGNDGNFQVVVDDVNRQALGTLVATRRSADNVQKPGRTVRADNALCYATNAAGVYRTCLTTDPGLIAVARRLDSESYLWFIWNAAGTCTSIVVGLGSQYKP